MKNKKTYSKPGLHVHGNLKNITLDDCAGKQPGSADALCRPGHSM